MKILLPLSFLLLVIYSANSQKYGYIYEDGYKEDKLMGIDFHLIGTSFHYAERLSDLYYIGFEIGFLPDIYTWVLSAGKSFTEENTSWSSDRSELDIDKDLIQLYYVQAFARWKPKNTLVEIDAGLRYAGYWHSIPLYDLLDRANFLGIFAKPMVGFNKFKIGVRLDSGVMFKKSGNVSEFVLIASPAVRFNFR